MIYYISDLHLGHQNVLSFDGRPFSNLADMHRAIIDKWNNTVTAEDTVYILGDFAWKQPVGIDVAKQLNGNKILIKGNHDIKMCAELKRQFEDILDYAEIKDNNMRVVLSHYPIAHWNHQMHGSVLLYGHVHNNKDWEFFTKYVKDFSLYCCKPMYAFNVGCMLPYMDYTPRTLTQILTNGSSYI